MKPLLQFTLAFLLSACAKNSAQTVRTIELDELEAQVTVGLDESADSLSVFAFIRDAAFLGDDIAVLDISPPFVRIFDETGKFKRALLRRGGGPGEAASPTALSGGSAGRMTVIDGGRVLVIDSLGSVTRSVPLTGQRIRGALLACGDDLVLLTTPLDVVDGPGALLRVRPEGVDTVMAIDSLRSTRSRSHSSYLIKNASGVTVYTEEVWRPRLVDVSCAGSTASHYAVPSPGSQERLEPTERGFALHPAQPPFSAGLAGTEDGPLWALNVVREDQSPVDSVTVVFKLSEPRRALTVRGWFTILDSTESGLTLLAIQEPVPMVKAVRTTDLVNAIRRFGAPAD